jgi:RimJ/RimL family protein N-acetyltransferase
MNREIATERLSLRPIGAVEVAALHRLWTEEGVRRFLWDGKIVPLKQTADIAETSGRLFEELGVGIWGVRESGCDELLGFAGYWHFRTPPSLELLFGVASDHWHRGIATEASRGVLRYGFEVLGFDTIEASTDVMNAASIRVLEKLGMAFLKRAVVDGLDTVFYSLRCGDWRKAGQASVAADAMPTGRG